MSPVEPDRQSYDDSYAEFDSPLKRQLRQEAYGTDIGQHSWVTAEELEHDVARLGLTPASRLLDLGCGPGGPLTFVVRLSGCHGSGMDLSAPAITAARARAASLGIDGRVALLEADLNQPIPFPRGSFDTVISLDVVLHLRDRAEVFREVARVLIPQGKFLFTDAGVQSGPISAEEISRRAAYGPTQFVPPGFNEEVLERAAFRLVERADRTASLLKNATGRITTRLAHRVELEKHEGNPAFGRQQRYLETVIALAARGALSRMMYLAKSPAARPEAL